MSKTVVLLGGYGNFGSRIAAALAHEPAARVFIAGRNAINAGALARVIGGNTEPLVVDHHSTDFGTRLRSLRANVLVHTAGPFQGQDYRVARACIEAGCHYLDIADGRSYVSDIGVLNAEAKANNVLIVSGASSLPALSSAVVDKLWLQFSRLDSIEHAISSGAKPPGVATMQGVLSYVGKAFLRLQRGRWQTVHGWQDVVVHRFPGTVGKRWLVNCDVPDLQLFPQRYPEVQSVVFRAGLGFATTTLATWALSWLVRAGVIANLASYSAPLHRAALRIEKMGSQWSAMYVQLAGLDNQQQPLRRTWQLLAGNDHGPNIPCFPAIALARKLLRDQVPERGATPCMGLLTVDEILGAIPNLNVRVVETE
jgi:hypothetical protein